MGEAEGTSQGHLNPRAGVSDPNPPAGLAPGPHLAGHGQSETRGGQQRLDAFLLCWPEPTGGHTHREPLVMADTLAYLTQHRPRTLEGTRALVISCVHRQTGCGHPSRSFLPNRKSASSCILLFSGLDKETRERLVAVGAGTWEPDVVKESRTSQRRYTF